MFIGSSGIWLTVPSTEESPPTR